MKIYPYQVQNLSFHKL